MHRSLKFVLAVLLAVCCRDNAPAQVYVAYSNAGVISKYDVDTGASINDNFVLGLSKPHGMCIANGMLYVVQAGSGFIGKFDAATGAAINAEFIPGLNIPQAIAVSGNAVYVSSFDWETNQPHIGKYDATTGATINAALVTNLQWTPISLTVSGNKLFVVSSDLSLTEYDATTGAAINGGVGKFIGSVQGLAQSDNWLWITASGYAQMGAVFKLDADTGVPAFHVGPFSIFISKLNNPTALAISGDELFVGNGSDTSIGKYNATTGEVINAHFIPSSGDLLGGLAVVPRAVTGKYGMADLEYGLRNTFLNFALEITHDPDNFLLGAGGVVAVVVIAVIFWLFWRRSPAPVEPIPEEEGTPEHAPVVPGNPEALPQQGVEEEAESSPAQIAPPRSMSTLAIVVIVILVVTILATLILGYFAFEWALASYRAQLFPGYGTGQK